MRRETAPPDVEISLDTLLRASRRLDWRFLLPNPDLGHVAYIGPARGTLLESLRLFSTSLTVIEESRWADDVANPAQHDVVVVSTPTDAGLRQAVQLLRPGGWLYLEAHGPLSRGRRFRRPRFARDYIRMLRQLDMDRIETYWHWPDFESCTKIIPLDDHAAILHILASRRPGPGEFLKSALARGLFRSGMLSRVVPHFSVMARRR